LKSQLSGYTFSPGGSPPRSCRLTCCARFVARLFLSALVTYDALIIAPGWTRFGFRHALLAAMFAALVLRTLQIVFFRHRDQILFFAFARSSSDNQRDSTPLGSTGGRQRKPASRTAQGGVSRGKSREWKLPIDKPAIAAAFPDTAN